MLLYDIFILNNYSMSKVWTLFKDMYIFLFFIHKTFLNQGEEPPQACSTSRDTAQTDRLMTSEYSNSIALESLSWYFNVIHRSVYAPPRKVECEARSAERGANINL